MIFWWTETCLWTVLNIQEYDCMLFLQQYLQASDAEERQHYFKSLYTDVVPYWFSRFLLLYRLQNITGISCCPSMMSPEILIFMTKHLFSLFFSSYKNCFHLFSIIYLGWTDVSGFFFLSLWSLKLVVSVAHSKFFLVLVISDIPFKVILYIL